MNGNSDDICGVRPTFPRAGAPEIIRAHQKDSYVEGLFKDHVLNILQRLKGSRFIHLYENELSSLTTLAYLALTTLIGNRTLGEEYTDLFYTTSKSKLPSRSRKAAYVLVTSLLPLVIAKYGPKVKSKLLMILDRRAENDGKKNVPRSTARRLLRALLENFSLSTLVTVNLAIFYFNGYYYQLSKRFFGLRYSFGHKPDPNRPKGSGYELLGLLIFFQLFVSSIAKVREYLFDQKEQELDTNSLLRNDTVEFDLSDNTLLPFIPESSRRCTLCLEYMKGPTSSPCGHLFCWTCIGEWCQEKPECPLCRQSCLEQNLLPLKV